MSLWDYIEKGGVIMYILLALNVVGFSIMIWKFAILFLAKMSKRDLSIKIAQSVVAKFGRENSQVLIKGVQDEIYSRIKKLESGLITVRVIASISPLLGLLGTVVGIALAFESIGAVGLGEPKVFANQISLALITTIGGLIVAIPHYIGYNYIIGILDSLEIDLEKITLAFIKSETL
jgi:biopolymer transport protein ExbB